MTNFALILLAISGCLFGASSFAYGKESSVAVYGLSLSSLLGYSGILLLVVGAALLILRWFSWTCLFIAGRIKDSLPDFLDPVYVSRPASSMELKLIHDMGVELFEGGVSSTNQMKKWYRVNPNIFWVVRRKGDGKREAIRGYFCIIPLTQNAVDLLKDGQISGQTFTTEHLSTESRPKSVYVGAIAAKGFKARGAVLHMLLAQIEMLRLKGTKNVFTKPVTKDGVRLVKKFDFTCIESDEIDKDKLHHLDLRLAIA